MKKMHVVLEEKVSYDPNTGEKKSYNNYWVRNPDNISVSLFTNQYSTTDAECKELSNLFAAAPEMLQELIDLSTDLKDYNLSHQDERINRYLNRISEVIKKARGDS